MSFFYPPDRSWPGPSPDEARDDLAAQEAQDAQDPGPDPEPGDHGLYGLLVELARKRRSRLREWEEHGLDLHPEDEDELEALDIALDALDRP